VLQRLGLHRDIALVGFDDFPLADLVAPSVTVVGQDLRALGATAADLLFERMHGTAALPRTVVLPTRLVARESGDIAPRTPSG
jgi:LacI family transcriptional regulator